jgi:hypothetical protein
VPRRLTTALLLVVGAAVAGCRSHTVTLAFAPEVGDQYRYRYEVEATITRALEGSEPEVTDVRTTLRVEEAVLEVTPAGVRAEVTLRRDGGAPRSSEVRLDRAGTVRGIDLVEGQRLEVFGLGDLSGVLDTLDLPTGPLAPGDRWSLDEEALEGDGRLARLGVIDGQDVAVVVTRTVEPIERTVPSGTTTAALQGSLRADGTLAYDLADGSLRRATSRARGEVDARIAPPPGVDADAVLGTIAYDIHIRVTRLN